VDRLNLNIDGLLMVRYFSPCPSKFFQDEPASRREFFLLPFGIAEHYGEESASTFAQRYSAGPLSETAYYYYQTVGYSLLQRPLP
jgi:hypothetical protein